MYYKHNIDAKQINNLYYSCVENKMPNISAEIETIVRQSRVLSENDFHQFLIDMVIKIENKIMFYYDDLKSYNRKR